jgi:hypothetical protein
MAKTIFIRLAPTKGGMLSTREVLSRPYDDGFALRKFFQGHMTAVLRFGKFFKAV